MSEAALILAILGRQRRQRLAGGLPDPCLLTLRGRGRVASALADAGVGGEGLEPSGVVQVAPRELCRGEQSGEGWVRPPRRDAGRPSMMGEAFVQLPLRDSRRQVVERGDAVDE